MSSPNSSGVAPGSPSKSTHGESKTEMRPAAKRKAKTGSTRQWLSVANRLSFQARALERQCIKKLFQSPKLTAGSPGDAYEQYLLRRQSAGAHPRVRKPRAAERKTGDPPLMEGASSFCNALMKLRWRIDSDNKKRVVFHKEVHNSIDGIRQSIGRFRDLCLHVPSQLGTEGTSSDTTTNTATHTTATDTTNTTNTTTRGASSGRQRKTASETSREAARRTRLAAQLRKLTPDQFVARLHAASSHCEQQLVAYKSRMHREYQQMACAADQLYAQLGGMRTTFAGWAQQTADTRRQLRRIQRAETSGGRAGVRGRGGGGRQQGQPAGPGPSGSQFVDSVIDRTRLESETARAAAAAAAAASTTTTRPGQGPEGMDGPQVVAWAQRVRSQAGSGLHALERHLGGSAGAHTTDTDTSRGEDQPPVPPCGDRDDEHKRPASTDHRGDGGQTAGDRSAAALERQCQEYREEVEALDALERKEGGVHGGWLPLDHEHFVGLCRVYIPHIFRGRPAWAQVSGQPDTPPTDHHPPDGEHQHPPPRSGLAGLLRVCQYEIPDQTEPQVTAHLKWFERFLRRKRRKKRLVQVWRLAQDQLREVRAALALSSSAGAQGPGGSHGSHAAAGSPSRAHGSAQGDPQSSGLQARRARAAERRLAQRRLVAAWRRSREQAEQAQLRQEQQLKQRAAQAARRKAQRERARVQAAVAQYQQQRREDEEQKRREAQEASQPLRARHVSREVRLRSLQQIQEVAERKRARRAQEEAERRRRDWRLQRLRAISQQRLKSFGGGEGSSDEDGASRRRGADALFRKTTAQMRREKAVQQELEQRADQGSSRGVDLRKVRHLVGYGGKAIPSWRAGL